jgi:C4-dicarboxylate-specific signal transduction histidine kinase
MLMISLAGTGLVLGSLVGQQQATSLRLRHQQLALSRALRLRSMGEIATAIAHEVNQPITSIKTYAGIAKDALEAERYQSAIDAVGKVRTECDRASAIIRATRESLRQEVLRPQPVQVEKLIDEVRELLLDRLGPNKVALIADVKTEAKTVTGDPVQLKQGLYNIIDNSVDAIEHTGAGGEITVTVEQTNPSSIDFVVRDSGPGFSQPLIDLGITPQLSTKPEGSGMGLSIARSVAEAHGGTLSIEREGSKTAVRLRITTPKQAQNEHRNTH